MNKIKLFFIFIYLIFFSAGMFSQTDISVFEKQLPEHPRLLMSEKDKIKIQHQINNDEIWTNLHNDILLECNKIISQSLLERKQIGMRLLAVSRESLRRIFFLSYAYRMTEEEKYFLRAEEELLNVCSFSDWNPSHFLDVAEMTLGVSIGYDWLYKHLSDESKKTIKEAIVKKGIQPSTDSKYNWWLEAKHNWNQVCNAGMTFGALAVYEEDPFCFQRIIDRSIVSIRQAMKDYDPDGAYPEGYSYWEYGTTFNVLFLSAIEKTFHADFGLFSLNGFKKTASYYEHMIGQKGDSFNYADCGKEYGLTPAMFWFAQKTENPSLLWFEKDFVNEEYRNNYITNRILPVVLLWGSHIKLDQIQAPVDLAWNGGGTTPVSLMRTSWTDPNAVYVGFKGGTASSNHAHMDAGSFIMEADGVRWAMDFGREDYELLESNKLQIWTNNQDSERWKVFRYNNFAHNTLTVDNALHSANAYAPIIYNSTDENFMSSISDLSDIFEEKLDRAKRGVAVVDKKYVVVRDEIKTRSDKQANIRWTMLTPAEVKVVNKNRIELKKDGKTLQMYIESKHPFQIKTWSTESHNSFDSPNQGTVLVGFEAIVPAGEKADFTVFMLPQSTKKYKKTIMPLDLWNVENKK